MGAGPSAPPSGPPTTNFGVYSRLTRDVAVCVGIIFWPYANRCGAGLAGYLGAVAAVIIAGGWSAVWTFRHRAARAHVLSLLLVLWGLILASLDVLPRVGYAKPTLEHPAAWTCS
jgi:putative flippase GtrA